MREQPQAETGLTQYLGNITSIFEKGIDHLAGHSRLTRLHRGPG